ncbi:YunG family protein [Prosthecodimorpha staleyi]|nr:hypothetical protein [Prosthecodimorpha staleyi]
MTFEDEMRVLTCLTEAWSAESSSQWSPHNPAAGQCGLTAALVHDRFGGRILKTRIGSSFHYYNEIAGRRIDFTESQFDEPPDPEDVAASRDEAAADGTPAQFAALSARFDAAWRCRTGTGSQP